METFLVGPPRRQIGLQRLHLLHVLSPLEPQLHSIGLVLLEKLVQRHLLERFHPIVVRPALLDLLEVVVLDGFDGPHLAAFNAVPL